MQLYTYAGIAVSCAGIAAYMGKHGDWHLAFPLFGAALFAMVLVYDEWQGMREE